MLRMEMKYDSLYSGLVSINKSLGGTQSMPDSEYSAMIDLMETLSNKPVGESGDVFDAVSTVATMAENGELPIQSETKVNVLSNGIKFGYSTFSSVPDVFDFSGEWTDTSSLFYGCSNLTSSPYIATKMVTDMSSMYGGCTLLTSAPELDFSNVENCTGLFSYTGLTSFGDFIAPKCTNMDDMFAYSMVVEIGNIDLPSITAFGLTRMDKLKRVGNINIPLVNNLQAAFYNCKALESAPYIDTTNVTEFRQIFLGCSSLTSIPAYNTSNATSMYRAFADCTSLRSIPLLDFGNVTNISTLFGSGYIATLTDLGGFKDLKINFTGGLDKCFNLTVDSLMNVINNLYDFVGNGETTTRTLQLGTNLSKLTPEQIAVATNKGWNLT